MNTSFQEITTATTVKIVVGIESLQNKCRTTVHSTNTTHPLLTSVVHEYQGAVSERQNQFEREHTRLQPTRRWILRTLKDVVSI